MSETASADQRAAMNDPSLYEEEYQEIRETFGTYFTLEAWTRCFFILMLVAGICLLTWRPSLGRLSFLFAMVNPNRGDRLDWRAVDDPVPPHPPAEKTPPPPEWRLQPRHSINWGVKRQAQAAATIPAGKVSGDKWARMTQNAWNWHADSTVLRRDDVTSAQLPPQKAMTAFRTGDASVWPAFAPSPETERQDSGGVPAVPEAGATASPLSAMPALAPLEPQTPAAVAGPSDVPDPRPAPAVASAVIDWKTREITGPIPGAYLIIYPKLRFVGLCVPGQGYIRKYNQIGVPRELDAAKERGDDGRVPYGRYYIADRHRDSDGSRLFLSWPSPEDARRIGLDGDSMARVESAWLRRGLPPQDTAAGGGVGLNGLRQWVDRTDGGFALEAPHMEEIFTALPDKAAVLIQP